MESSNYQEKRALCGGFKSCLRKPQISCFTVLIAVWALVAREVSAVGKIGDLSHLTRNGECDLVVNDVSGKLLFSVYDSYY